MTISAAADETAEAIGHLVSCSIQTSKKRLPRVLRSTESARPIEKTSKSDVTESCSVVLCFDMEVFSDISCVTLVSYILWSRRPPRPLYNKPSRFQVLVSNIILECS